MFKLPSNIYYRVFDKSFKESTARYIIKSDKVSPEEAQANRDAIIRAAGAKEIVLLDQVHGNDVYHATSGTTLGQEPKMDASYTDTPGVLLAIQTADCVPVLIADKAGKVVGAAHCGWKSAFKNILDILVTKMRVKGAKDFVAIIGPSIHQDSYEVDAKYFANCLAESSDNTKFFIPSAKLGHYMFNLRAYVYSKLGALGITEIDHSSDDTYTNPDKYPSYRRHCHTGEGYRSNILSTIMIIQRKRQ